VIRTLIDENELIILVLGGASLLIFIINYKSFKLIPSWKYFLFAFLFLVSGSLLTTIEVLFFPDILNVMEHLFLLLTTFFLMIWIVKITRSEKSRDEHSDN
jgi:hypothetical protein